MTRRTTPAAATTAASPASPVAGEGVRPDPKTCARFSMLEGTAADAPPWPAAADGTHTIHYSVNPSGAITNLTNDQMAQAVQAAFATWARYLPTIRFAFDGFTSRPPVNRDGVNVVGFGDPSDLPTSAKRRTSSRAARSWRRTSCSSRPAPSRAFRRASPR